ncbi:MAG: FKBP-type peptidyl-prolyl cis-trans isomerase [Prevotellaceae bacterium]|nr:FKBP-type peptidyl-prolyl cis-trans isomerase [Prevotellaceae bacterium]
MESNLNKYIAVAYKLYTVIDGETKLVEEAPENKPFQFISGYGITLDAFEKAVAGLEKGAEFDFTLSKEEAYGDYEDAHVIDLDKEIFTINGHFDRDNIYVDAVVPLQNEDGNRFLGKVISISDEKVKMDLNHPLAGKALNFKGHVVESREATKDEIQGLINRMSGEGCGCGCDDCGHDHDHHHHGDDGCGCGCGHCH